MSALSALFDTFSDNLALYKKDCGGRFMCPLCLRMFSRGRIRNELSKAHMIPQRLGGRLWTLACKKCNNKVGTEIESYEAERASFNWALSGDGKETTRVRVTARNQQGDVVGPVQADLGARRADGDRRLQLYLKPKGSNPTALALLNSLVSGESPAGGWTIEVTFRETRSSKRANLTYVHVAYLFMFHQFGYEWALDPCAEPIRNQIMSPGEPIIIPLAPRLPDLQTAGNELALLLVAEPPGWRNFLVVLPLLRGWSERQAVWMPLFGRPYDQPPRRNGVQLRVVSVPDCHQSLRHRDSERQGYRFILDHFHYDPVLHTGRNRSEGHR